MRARINGGPGKLKARGQSPRTTQSRQSGARRDTTEWGYIAGYGRMWETEQRHIRRSGDGAIETSCRVRPELIPTPPLTPTTVILIVTTSLNKEVSVLKGERKQPGMCRVSTSPVRTF